MPTARYPHVVACLLSAMTLAADIRPASALGSRNEMLRQLIHDAAQGRIPYQRLSPDLAKAVRPQAATAQSELSSLGKLKSLKLQSTDKGGMEIYRAVFENGVLEWAFHVDDMGLIDNAIYRPVKADPAPSTQ